MKEQGTTKLRLRRPENFTIGFRDADIVIPEAGHGCLVEEDALYVKNYLASPDVFRNGARIREPAYTLQAGDVLSIGGYQLTFLEEEILLEGEGPGVESSLLVLEGREAPFEGFPKYKRSPRLVKRVPEKKISIERPKDLMDKRKGGWFQLIVPPLVMIGISVAVSLLMKRGLFIVMAVAGTGMSLVVSVMRFVNDGKEVRENRELREKTYRKYLLRKRKEIYDAYQKEKEAYEYNYPSLQELQGMLKHYSSRIYEKSCNEEDFLKVTLGTAKTQPELQVRLSLDEMKLKKDELEEEAREVKSGFSRIEKPVVVDLKKAHLALVGEKEVLHEQIKALMVQLTFFHSYHDLEIVLVYDERYQEDFEWMRWYPHLRIHAINCVGMIHSGQKRDQILGSLHQILKERSQKEEESKKDSMFLPHFLFVIDEPKWIMDHSIMEYLDQEGYRLGFSILYTSGQRADLPENIGTIVILENSADALLLTEEKEERRLSFRLPDTSGLEWEWMARNLGVLEHMKGISAQIPESIAFFEMYGVRKPAQLDLAGRWAKGDPSRSLAVPLGARAKGDYVFLNLHEKAHGPHGLIAGTTGSGKSELLQSYILSLAVNFSPHEVAFLLIDYKGGGMAGLFRNLPHLLGTITNLDGAQSMRAMASIKSELSRRQNIFNRYHVNHINKYSRLFRDGEASEPLPHLFLISDEFAELKKDQPEFMSELVSAARIGRSLGVHLILATQKPTGVVDDQIWSNSRFRLALKVQNEADSKEILKTPDAANITQPGRAYLQVGNNEIYELFQSAWSGASCSGEEEEERVDDRVFVVNELGQGELVNQDLNDSGHGGERTTQLDAVVQHIHDYYETLDRVEVKKPWLPPLSAQMVSPQALSDGTGKPLCLKISMGQIDIPERQEQIPYELDLGKDGNLLYLASSGYGKSVFLTTVVCSLAMQNNVENLNFYLLDFGNSSLIRLNKLHHVADYIALDDSERLQKLMGILEREVQDRKKKLARAAVQNFEVYNQVSPVRMKAIVLILDHFDAVKELGYEAEEFYQKISRDGFGLGIFMIATATRSNSMKYATYNNFKNKVAGYLFDETDVHLIAGRSPYQQSEIRGRTLIKYRNQVNVMQVFTMVPFRNEVEYNRRIEALIQQVNELYPKRKAPRIPVLPENLYHTDLPEYRLAEKDRPTDGEICVGLDKVTVQCRGFRTEDSPFTILGEAARGKTNMLQVILSQIIGTGKVALVDSRSMELYRYKAVEGVSYIEGTAGMTSFLQALRQEVEERNELIREGLKGNAAGDPREICRKREPFYLVVDDWDNFVDRTKAQALTLAPLLNEAAGVGVSVILTAHSGKMKGFDEVTKFAKNTTKGLLLGNQGTTNVFPVSSAKELPKFRDGLLFHNGAYVRVRLPKFSPRTDATAQETV